MIETTTPKPIKTDYSNQIETRNNGNQSAKSQPFQSAGSKNPCHDGCNVKQEQVQNNRAETEQTEALESADSASDESAGVEKASGGNCPGSALIANILESLMQALEATNTNR